MLQGKVDEYEAAFQSVDTGRSGKQQLIELSWRPLPA